MDQKNRNPEICAQRAHVNAVALSQMGIRSGKVFATTSFYRNWIPFMNNVVNPPVDKLDGRRMNWDYHVANMVLVKTAADWTNYIQSGPNSAPVNIYLENQYAYHVRPLDNEWTDFKPIHMADAASRMSMAYSKREFGDVFLSPRPQVPKVCSTQARL